MKTLFTLLALTLSTSAFADRFPGPRPGPHPGPHPGGPGFHRPLPPAPGPRGDLRGYCPDYNHTEFAVAKDFAYSSSGLNLGSNESVQWAMQYNQTHACGTIREYAARYNSLYDYAYSSSYLNMGTSEARSYATGYAEFMPQSATQNWKMMFSAVRALMYSSSYLNGGSSESIRAAKVWNERGYCGDMGVVTQLKMQYRKEYDFAYSGSGLNMGSSEAKQYALSQLRYLTRCADLLR
jgi:hypothetical protein